MEIDLETLLGNAALAPGCDGALVIRNSDTSSGQPPSVQVVRVNSAHCEVVLVPGPGSRAKEKVLKRGKRFKKSAFDR